MSSEEKMPNILKEKINLKTATIQSFFETIDLIAAGKIDDISLGNDTKVFAYTTFGVISGRVAYLLDRDDDFFNSLQTIHKSFVYARNFMIKESENDGAKEIEIDSGFVPLVDVEIRYFNNPNPTKLDYFLLFADQVVGLTFGQLD
jgi:hypothetical protein